MKNTVRFILFAIITAVLSTNMFADVKIKARQTMSGQTTESTTYIKGKRQRSEQNIAGSGSMVTLTQCDLKRSVQLNPQAQVYILSSWQDDTTAPSNVKTSGNTTVETKKGGVVTTTVTTKDTGETRKMFGYTARHLIVTTETESSPDACAPMKSKMVTDGWYIDAAFVLDCDFASYNGYTPKAVKGGCQDKYNFKQMGATKRGYPVIEKMTMFDENGKETFTMTNEVIELSNAALDSALFEIPAGYREVQDPSQMYASINSNPSSNVSYNSNNQTLPNNNSSLGSTLGSKNSPNTSNVSKTVEPKRDGVVRIGLAGVKTGAVGEGINAAELAGAIQNTLGEYLKGTKIEIVPLEAKLASAIESEAKEKQCDYILSATVSHKKGGGGFGMFSKIAPVLGNVVPGAAGKGGQIAQTTVYTAANAAGNIKPKDELTLDIKLQNGSAVALGKQFKTKAKSAGEDIISPLVEQAAQAIVETVGK